MSTLISLKLRGFLVSFSATNPCEARNRYLLLQSGLLINGIKESQVCQVTVDSSNLSDHKWLDVPQQASTNKSSTTQLTKPDDESQTNEMFVSFQGLPGF
jgi:hypothetical protein